MALKFSTQAFVASASIASVLAASLGAMPRVGATVTKCVFFGVSCLHINGESLYVNYVQGGVKMPANATYFGHMEIWGAGFHVNTSDKTIKNPNNYSTILWDSERVSLYRNQPDGSQVCSRYWHKVGSRYSNGGVACLTIER
jgi:hypothetical protein